LPLTPESHRPVSLVVVCTMDPIHVHLTWSLTLIVTAVGLKKKSPIFTLTRLEARTGGAEIRALVARLVRTHWDSRAPGVRPGMLFMKFVGLFTVFR
jgi:hypothetical protein